MKNLIIILLITFVCNFGFSGTFVKSGEVVIGYDKEHDIDLTKSMSVTINTNGVSLLKIEGEELLDANYENSKISAYSAKPKKYFYFVLDLKPATSDWSGRQLIVRERAAATTSYCREGSNTLLTGFVGDGTKTIFCATLK